MKKFLVIGVLGLVLAVPAAAKLGDPDPSETAHERSQIRVEARDASEAARETAAQLRESARTALKQRLQLVRDNRKKLVAQKISNQMCVVNNKRVGVMNKHLDKYAEVLNRVAARNTTKDASVVSAVSAARAAISTARTAVEAQGNYVCEITISGAESGLGAEVSASIEKMHASLKSAALKVTEARKATVNAVQALAKIKNE